MNLLNLQVASSYANAWFKQAQQTEVLEHAHQDVVLLKQVVQENKNLIEVLQSPIIPAEKKLVIFQQLFSSRIHDLTFIVFSMMNKKRREAYLLPIIEKFLEIYRVYHQIQFASITTACKLPADLVGYFKDLIKNWKSCKEVILTQHVDLAVLGGFILRVGDYQLDNSLASKLAKMKKEFSIISD